MSKFKPGDKVRPKNILSWNEGIVIGPHPYNPKWVVIMIGQEYAPRLDESLELIPEPREIEGWVRIYFDGSIDYSRLYLTKELATFRGGYKAVYVSGTEGTEP